MNNQIKIVAFLGETYSAVDGRYYSMPPNAKFLQMTFGFNNVKVASPAASENSLSFLPNSVIDPLFFYKAPLPPFCTTKEFYKRAILQRGFYKKFIGFCDEIINSNPEAIFWARTPSPGGIIFALRVIRAKRKLLHHICGDARNTWKDSKYSGLTKILAYVFSKIVVKQLHKIIKYRKSLNLTSGSELFEFSSKKSKQTHQFLDVVSNGVDCGNRVNRERQGLNVTFIGRIVDDKGIFELLLAFNRARVYLQNPCHLTIVGSGSEMMKLEEIISQLNLNSSVSAMGSIDTDSISDVLMNTDVVVVPSKTNEGFPRVIFEAWSHCVPVIVSRIGGISAFVVNGCNGLVVSPGSIDEIYAALLSCNDPAVYSRLITGVIESKAVSTQSYWSDSVLKIVRNEFCA